jgi:regulator of sigma E protease
MNVIFAFVIATLIYFIGLPTPVNPPIVGEMEANSPEAQMGIKEGDRILMVNNQPIEDWQDITFATITARTNVLPVVIARGKETNTYYLTTEASPIGGKYLNLDSLEHPSIGSVESDMPAAQVDLKPGDKIFAVNGIPTGSQERMMEVISNNAGAPCLITFMRKGEKRSVTITPKYDPGTKRARIGVSFSPVYQLKHPLPWDQIKEVTQRTFGTISALIHGKKTGVRVKDLSGPVGILSILAAQVYQDYRLALSFLVLLNINLAIINMLPIPVLDGGHVTMSIIEKIRRRPLSQKFVEYVTTGFALLLICFMIYVTAADVKRFPLFRAMFQTKTQIEEPPTTPAEPAPAAPR